MADIADMEAGEFPEDVVGEYGGNDEYPEDGDDYLYSGEFDEEDGGGVPEEFDPDLEYDAYNERQRSGEWE